MLTFSIYVVILYFSQHSALHTSTLNVCVCVCVCVCVLVTQQCLTLCDLMGCGPPGSSVHGILWVRILVYVDCHSLLQWIFLTQGLIPGLLHCRQILYCLSHQKSPW